MRRLLFPALVVLSGCMAHEQMEARAMASWMGRDIHDAVSTFGPPTSVYQNGADTIYTWERNRGVRVHTSGSTYRGDWVSSSGYTSTASDSACTEQLTAGPDGRVTHWRWDGDC